MPDQLDAEKRIRNWLFDIPLSFRCASPYWIEEARHLLALQYGEGLRLPFTSPFRLGSRGYSGQAVNRGAAATPVLIEIRGSGETPKIENHTLGTKIVVERAIPPGSTLRVNSDPEALEVTLVDPEGKETPADGHLTLDSALAGFVLRPGINHIEYTPSVPNVPSMVKIWWCGRWEGL